MAVDSAEYTVEWLRAVWYWAESILKNSNILAKIKPNTEKIKPRVKNEPDLQTLKELCKKIFHLYFSPGSNPSGPLINRLKYFRIWLQFRRDIQSQSCLHGVQYTADSNNFNSKINFFLSCSPIKGFVGIVPLEGNREKQKFRFWQFGCGFEIET